MDAIRKIEEAINAIHSASAMISVLPEQPYTNGYVFLIDEVEVARIVKELDEAAETLRAEFSGSCKGRNCGSTNQRTHSAECFADHGATIGAAKTLASKEAELVRLREALEQALDDMGSEGQSVCQATKDLMRAAMTPTYGVSHGQAAQKY